MRTAAFNPIADMSDKELNAAVAREVMQWPTHVDSDSPENYPNYIIEPVDGAILLARRRHLSHQVWGPAGDVAAALNDIVERMRRPDMRYDFQIIGASGLMWSVDVSEETRGFHVRLQSARLSRAITEAALMAVRADKPHPHPAEPAADTPHPAPER